MTLHEELAAFYRKSRFGDVLRARPLTLPVYTGCMLVPLPNIEARRRYLKYHDLHHLITGYSVGRIGEGEVSAWELGTGSMFVSPALGAMNLIALSTGLVLEPGACGAYFSGSAKAAIFIRPPCVPMSMPAIFTRIITDITLGYTVFEAVKPRKRVDLY